MDGECGMLRYVPGLQGTGNGCPQFGQIFAFGWHFSGSGGAGDGKLERRSDLYAIREIMFPILLWIY
ncbi:hypothetical protein CFAM422_000311 [Trichoderma lentiforme]|uniref:Uncharacterized protein n=1 Tax=Trichoderma lentiforme TaxID=1567552 RepID=A0A9P4XRF3_9HYPO|nr:hypothetical protein CFAM422_000311 [Trichoderma lentiforme]